MKDVENPLTGNLLTANCWWMVCTFILLFLSSFTIAQTPDSSRVAPPDSMRISADTLTADSLILSDELKSKVKYHARDSTVYDIEGERVFLYGEAQITYDDIELNADYIELNFGNKNIYAKGLPDSSGAIAGLPVFKQGKEEFKSNEIKYNFESKRGKITDITTKDGDSFIHGETVKKDPDNTTYIKNGYYTTCDLPHPHYYIAAQKIKVIPNNKVVTGPAEMYIADVPTPFAIPFGFFPNRQGRASGIIFPTYGESTQLGFFLSNGGYYFGLSDHFDLALTGDIYSRGSWRANATSVYATKYRYNGNFSLNYSLTKTSQQELPDYSEEKGFFIRWTHVQDPKARPNSNFAASVNAGTSSFYRNNLSSSNNYLTNTFSSSVSYSKSWPGKPYSFSSSLTHSQNTITREINLSLPSANFSVSRQTPFKRKELVGQERWYEKIGVSYNSSLQNSISTYDTLLFKKESLDKFRYGIQHSIPVSTSFNVLKFFTVSPSIAYNERWYLQTINKKYLVAEDSLVTDTIAGFKAARDFGFATTINTRVYGMLQFKKGKIAAIRHVMTPAIGYSWRPDFSESKWGSYKTVQVDSTGKTALYSIYESSIYGGPSAGKVSAISFSLDNNLEMKTRQYTDTAVVMKKVKLLESLSANASYNFAADSLKLSNISLSGRTTIADKLGLSFSGSFDPYVVNDSGVRINTYEFEQNNRLARLTNGNISVNYTIIGKKKEYKSDKGTTAELNSINNNPEEFLDFNVPFNLAIGYNLYYSKSPNTEKQISQTVNFVGDIQFTQNWKVNFNSGYDFKQKDLSYTSVGVVRDLHCWEMRINWVPFGFQANYYFQINVKSSVLQDLKLSKKNDRFDTR